MIETYYNLINYTFPVFIYKDTDVLTIEDRRPSTMQLIFALAGIGVLVFTAISFRVLIDNFSWVIIPIFIGGALALFVAALLKPFRETYIFDKRTDTYTFVRQSLFKSQTEQGSLSQFRAVQIERRETDTENGTSVTYHVALLKNEGLLFGSPPREVLRENYTHPVFSDFSSEHRIAEAIESFLNFSPTEIIDG